MAVDATKVRVAVTGAVSRGLTTATAPTGTSGAITGFTDLGGISEDGVSLALPGGGDTTPIKVWQNGQTVRTLRTPSDDLPQLTFTMVETRLETIETYFGVTVSQTSTEGTFDYKVQNRTASSYVLDVIDGAELIRLYVPRGVVSDISEVTFANTEAVGWGVTIDAELDSTGVFNLRTWMTALKSA